MSDKPVVSPNPFRRLPTDPVALAVFCDVLCITKTLETYLEGPAPSTEAELSEWREASSKMIRSLETRKDLTWMVMAELEPDMMIKMNLRDERKRHEGNNLTEFFQDRLKPLYNHWDSFKDKIGSKPWTPEFDTETLPPLLVADEDEKPLDLSDVGISPEKAESLFSPFKTEHGRVASYFTRHAPVPKAYHVVAGVNGKEATAKIKDENGKMHRSKMANNPDFEPMWFESRVLMNMAVPLMWKDADAPGLTSEETEKIEAENEEMYQEMVERLSEDDDGMFEEDNCTLM